MRKKETATKNKKEEADLILGLLGLRNMGGIIAEVPEKKSVPEVKDKQKELS